ncbi:hypothetical protein MLD38_031833 [Melastoma candidum]|uniref:Uncharacterized protein n=1 Tax=Melastoma candidum TaxID=119954 RepID=A0ACB9MQT3_9MYRT|nr:hypothetical protein MLD38_031833 [Melastoma candidum]
MAGFLHIFDPIPRRQRPPFPTLPPDGGSACSSPAFSEEVPSEKVSGTRSPVPEPEDDAASVRSTPKAAFPAFEFKDGGRSPWKLSKDAPRLSLDSRAVTDARGGLYPRDIRTVIHPGGLKGKGVGGSGGGDEDTQRRSPSVIARLMGLENLPSSDPNNPRCKMELRRSASDSRANEEIYRFIEGRNYGYGRDYPRQGSNASIAPDARLSTKESGGITRTNARRVPEKSVAVQPRKGSVQRKSYYDTTDFFPGHNRGAQNGSLHEEIGKKLRARGINEPSKDLDSLKQILEAIQLKGLLHCKAGHGIGGLRNQRKRINSEDSPVMLVRPRSFLGRSQNEWQSPSRSPLRGRVSALVCSRANTPNGRRQPDERKRSGSEQGRTPPVRSPRAIMPRKAVPGHTATYRACRGGNFAEEKVTITTSPAEDEESTVSGSRTSTPSTQTETDKSKSAKGYMEGRTLLESCDKLLNSITEITAATAAAAEQQPSPVSVLDRSLLYEDELEGPHSLTKRGPLHFKDCSAESAAEDDAWSPVPTGADHDADDPDFLYVSDIVGASNCSQWDPGLFQLLEKRWGYLRGKDASSPASRIHRKLTFDAVSEILDRRRNLLRWKHAPWTVPFELEKADMGQVWSDYREVRGDGSRSSQEDMLESVRGMLGKDLTGSSADEWACRPAETTESAVDIERLIFKDVIGETIRDLATAAALVHDSSKSKSGTRSKLAF